MLVAGMTLHRHHHYIPAAVQEAAALPVTELVLCISFYDLINDYRVETVKQKMRSSESRQFTLLALAFDSGFKSKTSFNRVFKQKTGMSPSQYYEACRSRIAG